MRTRTLKLKLFTIAAVLLFIFSMVTPAFGAAQIESGASYYEIPVLSKVQDAYTTGVGIPLDFTRTYSQDSQNAPNSGPLGRGWTHSYNLYLQEYSDGKLAFFGQEGFARWFQPKGNGAYSSSPGDYGVLSRGPDGSFQLLEKSGFLYKFNPSLTLSYAQDTSGNRVSCTYDQSSRLTMLKHSDGDNFRLEYNNFNLITKLIDNAGREIKYDYSSDGSHLIKVTDESNRVTSYTYVVGQDVATNNRLNSITFPDNTHTFYTYNTNGRLSSISGDNGFGKQIFSYEMNGVTGITDATGKVTKIKVDTFGRPIEITSPDGAKTSYEYDSAFNPIKVTDPLGHVFTYNYDALGNLISTSDPLSNGATMGYDPQSNKITWIRDSLGQTTSFSYNSQGNLLGIAYPDGTKESKTYGTSNLLTNSVSADSLATSYAFNSQGKLTMLKNPLGYETKFTYTPVGDISSITDAIGHITTYQHDISGNLIKSTFSDGTLESYKYDQAGRLMGFTDRAGQSRSFSYDSNGFLQSEAYSSGIKLQLSYDKLGILSTVSQSGTTNRIDAAYSYDLSRRITLAKFPGLTSSKTYDVSYQYDAAGNRQLMSYPDGYALKYEYDASNRLTKISDTSNALIASYSYDAAGRQTMKTLGNGMYTTYSYDNLNRLAKLSNYGPDKIIQTQFEYARNSAGLVTSVKTLDGLTTYTYDNNYQLTNVKYPSTEVNYKFDGVGNRLSVETNLAVTPYLTNQLNQYTEVGGNRFSYDANGNLKTQILNGNTISYQWNENNQLTKVIGTGIQISYDYDYQGRLFSKVSNGIEKRYVWDGANLIAEMDSSGNLLTRYVYGSSINDVVRVSSNGINSWPQLDALGSVSGYNNNDGTLAGKFSYDIYGNIQSSNINKISPGFEGMLWDSDSNLYYSKSRWYDASVGRFINENIPPTPIYPNSEKSATNFLDRLGFQTQVEDEPLFLAPNGAPTGIVFPIFTWIMSQPFTSTPLERFKLEAEAMQDFGIPDEIGLSAKIGRYSFYESAFTGLGLIGSLVSAINYRATAEAYGNGQISTGEMVSSSALAVIDALSVLPGFEWASPLGHAVNYLTSGERGVWIWQKIYAVTDWFSSFNTKSAVKNYLGQVLYENLGSDPFPSSSIPPIPNGPDFSPPPSPPSNPTGGLGGVNFSSISLNYISVSNNSFDYVVKAQQTSDLRQNLNLENGTKLSFASFLTGLVLPESKFWVNLNPWEPDRIIEPDLGSTDVGRIMLEADLAMKKSFTSYENPSNGDIGMQYWNLLDQKSTELINGIMQRHSDIKNVNDVQFSPVTRHWIVPDKVTAYENGNEIYIINATLTVNSEATADQTTYSLTKGLTVSDSTKTDLNKTAKEFGKYVKDLDDQMILPLVVQDINNAQNYSDLRQIYISLALAQWYKNNQNSQGIFANALNSGNVNGLKSQTGWSPTAVWNQYMTSFKQGDYRYLKNSTYQQGSATIIETQTYIGGGVDFSDIKVTNLGSMPSDSKELVSEAAYFSYAKDSNNYYFGDEILVTKGSNVVPVQPEIPDSTNNPSTNYSAIVVVGVVLAVAALVVLYGYSSIKKRSRESTEFDNLGKN